MIDGFKVFVTGKELKEHLQRRIGHHMERVEFYEKNKAEFEKSSMAAVSGDPIKEFIAAGGKHRGVAELFRFYVDHIPDSETYMLQVHELDRLEFWVKAQGF